MTELSACGRFSPANFGGAPEMLFPRERRNEFKDLPT
jgi:hypothetical protein